VCETRGAAAARTFFVDLTRHHLSLSPSLPFTLAWSVSLMDIVVKTQGFLSNWTKSGEADWYVHHPPFSPTQLLTEHPSLFLFLAANT